MWQCDTRPLRHYDNDPYDNGEGRLRLLSFKPSESFPSSQALRSRFSAEEPEASFSLTHPSRLKRMFEI